MMILKLCSDSNRPDGRSAFSHNPKFIQEQTLARIAARAQMRIMDSFAWPSMD
jgi:hypothetical protein